MRISRSLTSLVIASKDHENGRTGKSATQNPMIYPNPKSYGGMLTGQMVVVRLLWSL